MDKIILMTIICWTQQNGGMMEAWRLEQTTTMETCITMNQLFTISSDLIKVRTAIITVKCGE